MPKFQVTCECPTPLRENPAEIEAEDKTGAVLEFKKLNGISKTKHPLKVEPVEGERSEARSKKATPSKKSPDKTSDKSGDKSPSK